MTSKTTSPPKRILVTGGAGFIGSRLCERLLELGHYTICLDDFSTGHMASVEGFRANPLFEIIEHDVCLPISLEVAEIYNLACPASPVQYQSNPLRTIKTAVIGALNMLELAEEHGARVLQASTSEVYGDPAVHPQDESYRGNVNTIGPRACYDEGKRCAESLFSIYKRQRGLDAKIARIFNTYGPGMDVDDGRVASTFIVQALRDEDITVFGDGTQTRSFCYVSDMVDGLISLMEHDSGFSGPVNLGNPQDISMLELAGRIIALTGSSSRIVFRQLPDEDPARRKPEISLARKRLGWSPTVALDIGLGHTIEYFKNALRRTGAADLN